MSGLYYVGKDSAADRDLETRPTTAAIYAAGTTRSYVTSRINTAITGGSWATKSQVDTWDSGYASRAYYIQRDDLLVPVASKGAPNGVASLTTTAAAVLGGGTGYVVSPAQVPILGAGTLRGPWGVNRQYTRTGVESTPVVIGSWIYNPNTGITNFGVVSHNGQFLAFTTTAARNIKGRTVLEVRVGTTDVYAEQTLIATGYGRTYFDGYQMITVLPASATSSPATWSSGTTVYVNLWMYNDGGGISETTENMTYTGTLFLARTAQ